MAPYGKNGDKFFSLNNDRNQYELVNIVREIKYF